jgi:hypothetical protein
MELERCDFAWQVLGDRISPVLLKGKTEGGKQAISHGEYFANAFPLVFSGK